MIVHRAISAILLVGSGHLLLACGGNDADEASSAAVELATRSGASNAGNISDEQELILADGEVSTAEYTASFGQFETCAEDSGHPLVGVEHDVSTGLVTYGVDLELMTPGISEPTNSVNDCFQRHFSFVELVWQTTNESLAVAEDDAAVQEFESVWKPCLIENDVEVPDTIVVGSPIYSDLVKQAFELTNSGRCSS